jgi:hypothetical protein
MDELAKIIKHFVYRDSAYIIGGSCVIVVFFRLFNRPDLFYLSTAGIFLFAGVAYAVGYALQDGLSITRLLTTSIVEQPPKFVGWLYGRFERIPWVELQEGQATKAREVIMSSDTSGHFLSELQRIETLLVISTALGSSAFVSGILLAIKAVMSKNPFDISIAISVLIIAFILICLGWLKSAQWAQHSDRYAKALGWSWNCTRKSWQITRDT